MERCFVIVLAGLVLAACGAPVTTATPGRAGFEQPAESAAVRRFDRGIDVVRALAYATVIDLGMDITSSDALGADQSLTAEGPRRDVEVALLRLGEHETQVLVAARSGAAPDRETAERVVEGIASRF